MDQSPRPGACLSLRMDFISNTSLDCWYRFLRIWCGPTPLGRRVHGLRLYIYPHHWDNYRRNGSFDGFDWTRQLAVNLLDGEDDQNLRHLPCPGFGLMRYCPFGEGYSQARCTLRLYRCQLNLWLEPCGLLFPLWVFVSFLDHDRL